MRQIKFRAWIDQSDKYSKLRPEMKYFSDKERPEILMNPGTGALWFAGDDEDSAMPIMGVVRLMQDTGRKDRNGKSIYDGDILQEYGFENQKRHVRLVKFNNDLEQPMGGGAVSGFEFGLNFPEMSEVIGNIYENPELMEVK